MQLLLRLYNSQNPDSHRVFAKMEPLTLNIIIKKYYCLVTGVIRPYFTDVDNVGTVGYRCYRMPQCLVPVLQTSL